MKKNALLFFVICCFVFSAGFFYASAEELPPFTRKDRVLVLAPHPDDETIAAAGVIQRALRSGARVQVVCYTNGDMNEMAVIAYEKRFPIPRKENIHLGELRRQESICAMQNLGLLRDDLLFLGYPDFGTFDIFTRYWDERRPYRGFLTLLTKVPYADSMSPGASFIGQSILGDIKKVISGFKPTKIFVSHPADTNRDHESLYLFLRVALWDLEGSIKEPAVYPYLIHVLHWPKTLGYHPELTLYPPEGMGNVVNKELKLTDDEIAVKNGCVECYKSQIAFMRPYLFTFVRKNEIFGDYPEILLHKYGVPVREWHYLSVPDSKKDDGTDPTAAYAATAANIYIKIDMKHNIRKMMGLSIYLMGYSPTTKFASMPKVRISFGIFGIRIFDGNRKVRWPEVKLTYEKKALILRIPLNNLGDPDRILGSIRMHTLPFEATAWRIISFE